MSINDRKQQHIAAILNDADVERYMSGFDSVYLTHRALPELNLAEIDTQETFLGKTLNFPLLISSMTGGSGVNVRIINRRLSEAAQACGIAMAVGSQRIAFIHPEARESFYLRSYAPDIPLLGNLGMVQLNYGFDDTHCQQVVEMLDADGLYLHLNPLQEAVQPEGNTNFAGLAEKLAVVVQSLSVPVLLKEVGCGLSPADIELGKRAGIRYFDIAGRGGTSWSRIEHHRRLQPEEHIGLTFQDWGITTVSALSAAHRAHPDVTLIASGGIRSGIDMAKAVILGADICGIAAPLLRPAMHSTQAVINLIRQFEREYRMALFLLGCANNHALRGHHELLEKVTLP